VLGVASDTHDSEGVVQPLMPTAGLCRVRVPSSPVLALAAATLARSGGGTACTRRADRYSRRTWSPRSPRKASCGSPPTPAASPPRCSSTSARSCCTTPTGRSTSSWTANHPQGQGRQVVRRGHQRQAQAVRAARLLPAAQPRRVGLEERQGAPRGASIPGGGERTPPPVCRSRAVKPRAARPWRRTGGWEQP